MAEQQQLLFDERRILTVSQLTRSVKVQLERGFDGIWVRGEISNLRVPTSGHSYFNLKDNDACIKAVLFKATARTLKLMLKEGMEVLAKGRLTVYEPKGEYQLVLDTLEPVGAGALQAAFEDLKKRLAAEGLFDTAKKKPLPFLPRRIGIVTSPTGAAVRDILAVLARRAPGVEITIAPVRVQGDGSASEIANGIRRLDREGLVDVIIVARGGGSLEDLWAFNEEVVARALSACKTPTISAVGHEIDFTIADFVADKRAPTPSAAAEIVVPDERELRARLREGGQRLENANARRMLRLRTAIDDFRRRLRDPRRVLADERLAVDDLADRAALALTRRIAAVRAEVVATRRTLFSAGPQAALAHERHRLARHRQALGVAVEKGIVARTSRLAALAGRLESISPLAVLARGYALVRDEETGAVVKAARDTKEGQGLEVTLAEGKIRAVVKKAGT